MCADTQTETRQDMEKGKKRPKSKKDLEFRYYEMPSDTYVMALLGERWILNYGTEAVHFHNYLEIGYCYYGEGEMVLGQKRYPYQGETFTVIPQNIPHRTCGQDEKLSRWEYLFIDIEGFLKKLYRDRPVQAERMAKRIESQFLVGSKAQYPALAGLIRSILEELRECREFYKESVRGYLQALAAELCRAAGDQESWEMEESGEERITSVLKYISAHSHEELRISTLAQMCHVSETHFRRMFEKVTNASPVEYINMVRIQHACTLLAETTDSIEEIRERVGFATASTFNRNFRRMVKMSPGQWRRQKDGRLADYKISIYKGW